MKFTNQILKKLIENKDKEFTNREISILLKKDYKNTYDAVQKLSNSIKIKKKGNSSYLSFKPVLTDEVYKVENIRNANIQNPKLKLIENDLESINNPFFIAVLFGSYAKNTHTKHSDIDICIIHDNKKEFEKIRSALSIHSNIEIHDFTYEEFIKMLRDKPFNVGHEIVKSGIILKNIESYYNLMKHE